MKFRLLAPLVVLLLGSSLPAAAQSVKIQFHDGHVDLTANNASVRAILTEWQRLGDTRIVNAERIAGQPVTLQLTNTPERQALDIIMRGVGGYIAGARSTVVPGQSAFDRLLLVASSGTPAPRSPAPAFTPPSPQVQQMEPDPDDDPASDVPPDDDPPQDENRNRRQGRFPAARPQPYEPDSADEPQAEPQAPTANPANPFAPVPVPQPPQRPRSQPDPEP